MNACVSTHRHTHKACDTCWGVGFTLQKYILSGLEWWLSSCSHKGLGGFDSQHPPSGHPSSVGMHTLHTQMCRQILTHIKQINQTISKGKKSVLQVTCQVSSVWDVASQDSRIQMTFGRIVTLLQDCSIIVWSRSGSLKSKRFRGHKKFFPLKGKE